MNFITRDESAIFYECGYSCDNALLLVFENEKIFITDSRYTQEAKKLEKKKF
jgi:Xaa-Pro aminopeptidase